MENNYDIFTPFFSEFKQIGFNEGYRKGSSHGFKKGVIATIVAYGIYKIVDWYKEETRELDD